MEQVNATNPPTPLQESMKKLEEINALHINYLQQKVDILMEHKYILTATHDAYNSAVKYRIEKTDQELSDLEVFFKAEAKKYQKT